MRIQKLAEFTGISPVWLRRQIKSKKILAEFVDGAWEVPQEEADRVKEREDTKQARRLARREEGGWKENYKRPSLRALDLVARKVERDPNLITEEKQLFQEALQSYRDEYEAEYQARKAAQASQVAQEGAE